MTRIPRLLCVALAVTLTTPGLSQAQPVAASPQHAPGSLAAGLDAARATDYPLAESTLRGVSGADRPAALVALARVLFEQGRFADADRSAQQALASPAQRLVALALRADILAAQGKVNEAIAQLEPNKDSAGVGGRRVRLSLGELLIRAGRRADAEPVLLRFADDYANDTIASTDAEGLAMVGRAMHLLRHAKDANRAFNESERAERGRVETLKWRASLYLDKFDPGHAEEVLSEALGVAPHDADAKVLLARVKLEEALDFDAAESLATDALAADAKHTGAYAVRAGIALRDGDLAKAAAAIDAGLAIDPNQLELLSLRAAGRFLADDLPGFAAAKKAVFNRNKEYAQAYSTIGEFAEWEHRYGDVVAMMREAVALDPNDSKAWAELGLMQTRAGDEALGIQSLKEAWRRDHFNVRVYNTLELLYGQWVPRLYDTVTDGLFTLRYPKDETSLLQRYAPKMLGEAWGAMKAHYMFVPSTPVAVELYRTREHFSVRTSGLPNIGIQGVCFGHVVAAMSPNSEPFNWGNVLWHELAHVFAIQLSKNHVPRWFTEGLSEYETMIRRPEWQRELDPQLYMALKEQRLPGALDMNAAFTHAKGEVDVTTAYYAASQMLAFTAERFGFPRIAHALELWGQGHPTKDVFPLAFGMSAAEYDSAFRTWAMARLARYQGQFMFEAPQLSVDEARKAVDAHPESARAHAIAAVALARQHDDKGAARELEAALKLDPSSQEAHFVAARLALKTKSGAEARSHLEAIKASGGDGYRVEEALADVAANEHDAARQRAALEAAYRFDPTQPEAVHALLHLATEEKRDADTLVWLRALARIDQHDRETWEALLDKLVAQGAWQEARSVGESAIYVDVASASNHVGYARALAALGEHAVAAFELESALLCQAKPEDEATAHALLARERLALGNAAGARSERDEALRLDPQNREARALAP